MNKRWRYYTTLMAGILLFTFLVPVLIRAGSRAFISRFAPGAAAEETETEAAEDRFRIMEGFTEAGNENPEDGSAEFNSGDQSAGDQTVGSAEDDKQHEHDPDLARKELQERKEQTDDELAAYLEKQDPDFTESRNGMLEAFAGGRESDLTKAVADHLYGTYGTLYDISTIDVVDFIDDNSSELTCQIRVTAMIGSKEYSEYYFATYNKVYDFYSIYAYHE